MKITMAKIIQVMYRPHNQEEEIIRHGTYLIDLGDQDLRKVEQLEELEALKLGLEFNTFKITMSREFYKIKLQVKELKRHQHMRHLCQSMLFKNGGRNSGRQGQVDSRRSGNFLKTRVKRIMRLHRH